MTYLVVSLLPFLTYFSDHFHWWTITVLCHLVIGFIGLWVRNWRILALLLFGFLAYFTLPWYSSTRGLPDTCQQQVDSITGIVKASLNEEYGTLDLMKVRIWCREKTAIYPLAQLHLNQTDPKRLKWFSAGEEIELVNVTAKERGRWGLDIAIHKGFKAYSLSFQESVLSKSELFIYLRTRARYYLDDFSLGVFKALALADRSSLTKEWKASFRNLGVMHIFAISGMHIGIIFVWLTVVFRRLFSLPFGLIDRGHLFLLVDLLSLGIIIGFVHLIGAPISSKRAVIMLCWFLLNKHLLYWQPLLFVLMGVAGYVLLEQPAALGQVSFQLSFLSVAAILSILTFLPVKSREDSPGKAIWKVISSIFFVSGWILMITLPVLGTLNREWSLISPINNVFHILVMSLVLLPLVLVTLIISILGYYIGVGLLEFYCYALVDFALKGWEWILLVNHDLNRYAMWDSSLEWSRGGIVSYWILLFGAVYLFQGILKYKKKTNVHFLIDKVSRFLKNAVVHLRTK